MTSDELKVQIRALTRRIGAARSAGDMIAIETLRLRRLALACTLAHLFDEWMLVNAEGRTEFVGREEFTRRMHDWLERSHPSRN